jgi:SAM-dependent methyltransferase
MRSATVTGARVVVLAGATALAFFSGGFFDVPRLVAGAVAWLLVAVAALLGLPLFPRSTPARVAVAGLAGLCAWVGISLSWAPLADPAYDDLQRVVAYLGALLAACALLRPRAVARAAEPALAAGALIVVGYGLSERVLPGLVHLHHSGSAGGRLEQPLTYWNAMGFLAAFGLVLCARLAGDGTRPRWLRAAAAAGAAPLGLGIYVSFSRGAVLACGVGLVVLVAAAPDWAQLRGAAIALGAGVFAALAATPYDGVTGLSGALSTREREGAALLGTVAAIALLAALLSGWAAREEATGSARSGRLPHSRHAPLAATLLVVAAFGVFVGLATKEARPAAGAPGAGAQHLTTLRSNRYDYWRVARKAFTSQPIRGIGSGGFRVAWLRDRPFVESVHDAHSLYLETAAELGLVGVALLAAAIGGAAVSLRRAHRRDAVLAAGPVAALAMWAVHAGVDWDWEMPAITLPVLVLAGLVLGLADRPEPPAEASAGASLAPGYRPPSVGGRLRAAIAERGFFSVARDCLGWAGRRLRRPPPVTFAFAGHTYASLHHPHNRTWLNERAVEVPIAQRAVDEQPASARVLEVGHVLGHYGDERPHDVVDRYESADDVVNVDVLEFAPAEAYDLVVTVSTLEHVGWDEEPRDPGRALLAVERLRALLAPGGRLVATVPVGYHPELDRAIRDGRAGFDSVSALRRRGDGSWEEVPPAEAWDAPYDHLLYEAAAVLVCTAGPAPPSPPG